MIDTFMVWITMMLTQVYTYPQAYQVVLIKYVQFLYVNHTKVATIIIILILINNR